MVMKSTRYSISRQKVCQQCSASKAKCDRSESGCSRCVQRGLTCIYPGIPCPQDSMPVADERAPRNHRSTTVVHDIENVVPHMLLRKGDLKPRETHYNTDKDVASPLRLTSAHRHTHDGSLVAAHGADGLDINDFVDLNLICPINAESIANRWLGAYIPLPNQKIKKYPTAISAFLHQITKSYVTVAIRGRGYPPFIHTAQVTRHLIRPPLSTCLSLIRMCEHQLPGSEETTLSVLQQEMQNLFEHRETFDAITLLCAFQAYLIFTMVLFFCLGRISSPFLREAVMNLQEFACAAARRGLVCEAEQKWLRPKWESWIVAEANRRTLYTMYLFDGVLSAYDGLPTFIGTELSGLPAPASQTLWRASLREQWIAAYNTFLADWSEGGLRIDELWPVPGHFEQSDVVRRRNRVDRWLEGVDEYGTMLYAVSSCTHG